MSLWTKSYDVTNSNESSLPVLTHGDICLSKFYKMKCGNVVEICLWTHLAVKGLSGYQAFDTLSLALTKRI